MYVMNQRRIRDEKIAQLKKGHTVYVETHELLRLMKRRIIRENMQVHFDYANTGCWILPLTDQMSS